MTENHKNIHTTQKRMAEMIADTELLVHVSDGTFKPLLASTLTTYISIIVNEDGKRNGTAKTTRKKAKK